jgi:hypothetical protein
MTILMRVFASIVASFGLMLAFCGYADKLISPMTDHHDQGGWPLSGSGARHYETGRGIPRLYEIHVLYRALHYDPSRLLDFSNY